MKKQILHFGLFLSSFTLYSAQGSSALAVPEFLYVLASRHDQNFLKFCPPGGVISLFFETSPYHFNKMAFARTKQALIKENNASPGITLLTEEQVLKRCSQFKNPSSVAILKIATIKLNPIDDVFSYESFTNDHTEKFFHYKDISGHGLLPLDALSDSELSN